MIESDLLFRSKNLTAALARYVFIYLTFNLIIDKQNDSGVFLTLFYLTFSFILCFLDGADVQEQSEISAKGKKYVFNLFEK